MYEKSIALIYKKSKIIGWMSTSFEADLFCNKNHDYSWDFYSEHKNYVILKELLYMTIHTKVS